jgi:hypothetical protein
MNAVALPFLCWCLALTGPFVTTDESMSKQIMELQTLHWGSVFALCILWLGTPDIALGFSLCIVYSLACDVAPPLQFHVE